MSLIVRCFKAKIASRPRLLLLTQTPREHHPPLSAAIHPSHEEIESEPKPTMPTPQPPRPKSPLRLLAFVDPTFHPLQGPRLLDLLRHILRSENVFDFKADRGPERGLESRALNASMQVRIFVAGSDTTFSAVATAVEKRNLTHCRLALIPMACANDMARVLGWGSRLPRLPTIVQWALYLEAAKARKLNVWRLSIDALSGQHPYAPKSLMCNYLSLGADAHIQLAIRRSQWADDEKYTSRLRNFRAYVNVAMSYICAGARKIWLKDHIEWLTVDDRQLEVGGLQALLFLNIPSYASGGQPWGMIRGERRVDKRGKGMVRAMFVDDGKFEVIGLRSLSHVAGIKALGMRGVRLAQGRSMRMRLRPVGTPFQADGHPWEQQGGEVRLDAANLLGVVQGPHWRTKSKKSATFTPRDDRANVGRFFESGEIVVT